MAGVTLRNVIKKYGETQVIHGIDLDIKEGEFCVFVGPSGCGKSTLMRMVAGLEETTEGTIKISERDVTRLDPAQRGVAMVFQTYALYPHMTVEENMGFGLKMTGHDKAMIDERVNKAANILHLGPMLKRTPKQLSGGQRQRVAIGRAIVREPKVFLFDEPLSNLDAKLRVQMRLEIRNLHEDLKITSIYVTHDQVEAMTLADKIVVLRAGLVEQVGSPLKLYDDPDNAFVAGFIGSPKMNFLAAKAVSSKGKTLTVELPEFDNVKVPMPIEADHPAAGENMLLGIRPEHFDPAGKVKIKTKIDVIEDLGGVSYAYSRSDEEAPLIIEMKDSRGTGEGEVLETGFDPARAFLFSEKTSLRVR